MKWKPTYWKWPFQSLIPTLGADEVHVWLSSLELPRRSVERLRQTLVSDELARAERFHFDADREHFIVARGLLRSILGGYLSIEPDMVEIRYNTYGKPSLAEGTSDKVLKFNISHSSDLALYAFAYGRELGVDLERLYPKYAGELIAERFFSPQEIVKLHALPPYMRQEAFLRCWTRKEAYVKARGEGLSLALDQFEVSIAPEEPAALLNVYGDPSENSRWVLQEITEIEGHLATLVIEAFNCRINIRSYSILWS